MTFEEEIIQSTVSKLLSGSDYRDEVVNSINSLFFDFCITFFRRILAAKLNSQAINMEWYSRHFINSQDVTPDEAAIYSGLNRKTITNIHGHATRRIILEAANDNFEYLRSMLEELENDTDNDIAITISISHKDITVNLSLTESLIVINALATKKLQIRGGAWSAIGKKVEKPLVDELCRRAGVPADNIDNRPFTRDKKKAFDRETDYRLISRTGQVYRVEVKLMGKGNPESADASIARDCDIFIADTLSEQNCAQLKVWGIEYLELRNNSNSLRDFVKILSRLDIPHRLPS